MADFTYKNVSVAGAATLEEAKQQAVIGYLRQFSEEPGQQEIDALLAEIETEEAEQVDFSGLETDITNQVDWIGVTIPEIDTGLGLVDSAFTNPTQRALVRGLLQNQKRILQIVRVMLKAWRFVIRRLR